MLFLKIFIAPSSWNMGSLKLMLWFKCTAAAMVILAYWGALTFALENVWWSKYAGRKIVDYLTPRLVNCDSRWNEVLHWCCNGVEIVYNI